MRTFMRWCAIGLAVSALGACVTDAGPGQPGPSSPSATPPLAIRIALLEDLHEPDGAARAAPAFQGAKLAFTSSSEAAELRMTIELVPYDTAGDPVRTTEVVAEISDDPSVLAAIAAPGLDRQAALGDALDAARMPWISLSSFGSALGDRGWAGWRRLVADQTAQGATLAAEVDAGPAARSGACVVGDGTSASRSLLRAVLEHLRSDVVSRSTVSADQEAVAASAADLRAADCGAVVWGGDGAVGGALRRQLVEEGMRRVPFLGGDRMRVQAYLEAAGPAAEGTRSTCPCVDLSTSTQLAAQRFIQDYQAEFGLAPGPYAVEAWDAANLLLGAFRSGATTRAEVLAAVDATDPFVGLGGIYRFAAGGDLVPGSAPIGLARVEGGRWIPTPEA